MPSIHRQLRNWCRRRGYVACESFASRLDEELQAENDLSTDTLLRACRKVAGTRFFRDNELDREQVASELADYLNLPPVRANLKKRTPDNPEDPQDVSNPSDPPPDLFISYYHEDAEFVERLTTAVARNSFTVWYDQRGLTSGTSFPREIDRAIGSARKIGIVCTENALQRPWVRKEMDVGHVREGQGEGDVLLPLLLEECNLPPLLSAKQWCNFTQGFEAGTDDLLQALSSE